MKAGGKNSTSVYLMRCIKNSIALILSSSIHASKNWGRRERITVFGLMLAFVGFASYRIHSPGLYYDELLFVSARWDGLKLFRRLMEAGWGSPNI